ncbi:MAG TPA: tripartite tricarboxylate transporter substrate binding protein, partial [Burkholderiales bacterium]|nr:tripartite tricarboxylate transporter substrate binding protein [Burkholderiales bacterium]
MKRLFLTVLVAALPLAAGAQQFPAKPIHLVVTFAAGGAMDLTARSMAAVMSESFGQVIVEN